MPRVASMRGECARQRKHTHTHRDIKVYYLNECILVTYINSWWLIELNVHLTYAESSVQCVYAYIVYIVCLFMLYFYNCIFFLWNECVLNSTELTICEWVQIRLSGTMWRRLPGGRNCTRMDRAQWISIECTATPTPISHLSALLPLLLSHSFVCCCCAWNHVRESAETIVSLMPMCCCRA